MLTGVYDGQPITSTELTDEEWAELRQAQKDRRGFKGRLVSRITGAPLTVVQRGGLRFFRAYKGYDSGLSEHRESTTHLQLKSDALRAAKKLGYAAEVEHPSPFDREWIADVWVERAGRRPLAVEIQCSRQTDDMYEYRTRRYADAGVDCIWFDAHLDHRDSAADCWAGCAEAETCYPTAWCGTRVENNIIRIPVDARRPDGARAWCDGAWWEVGN